MRLLRRDRVEAEPAAPERLVRNLIESRARIDPDPQDRHFGCPQIFRRESDHGRRSQPDREDAVLDVEIDRIVGLFSVGARVVVRPDGHARCFIDDRELELRDSVERRSFGQELALVAHDLGHGLRSRRRRRHHCREKLGETDDAGDETEPGAGESGGE